MITENMLGKDFDCLAKRVIYPRFTCHELSRETADHMIKLFTMADQQSRNGLLMQIQGDPVCKINII